MRWPRGDAGALAPLVPILGFVLLLLGGLVIDASRLLNARGRAVAYAEEAARAGAGAIEPGQAILELDEAQVQIRVAAYCSAIRADVEQNGGVTTCQYEGPLQPVSGTDGRLLIVRVSVSLEMPASLLGIVGVQTLRASGVGNSRPYEGVDQRDVDSSAPPVEVPVPVNPPAAPPGVDVPIAPLPPPVVTCPDPTAVLPFCIPVFPGLPPVVPGPTPSVGPGPGPVVPSPGVPPASAAPAAPSPTPGPPA